jgi:hypothetical protein
MPNISTKPNLKSTKCQTQIYQMQSSSEFDVVPVGDGFCECLKPYGNWLIIVVFSGEQLEY